MKLLQLLNEIEVRNIRSYRVTVGDKTILVYPEDEGEMNWDEAFEACKKLGDGKWRLPTIEELEAMYEQLHKEGKGNFKNTWYWSSSASRSWPRGRKYYDAKNNEWTTGVLIINFINGRKTGGSYTSASRCVRPVRTLE